MRFILIFLLLSITETSWGESSLIDHLVSEVLSNNPELRSTEAEIAIATGDRRTAGQWKNPEVSLEYGKRSVRNSTGEVTGEGTTRSASITQTFEFPGKGSLRKAIADKNVQIAELGLEQFKLALEYKARLLLFQLKASEIKSQIAQEMSDQATEQIELLKKRSVAGVQGLLDLRIIEANLIETKKAAIEAKQNHNNLLSDFNSLRGVLQNKHIDLSFALSPPTIKTNIGKLIEDAQVNNRQLQIRSLELERATQEVSAARLDAAPDFSVGPFFSQDRAGDKEVNVGIGLSFPLPLWNFNRGQVDSAKGRLTQTDALQQKSQAEVATEITKQFKNYSILEKQLKEFHPEFLTDIRHAATIADRHYRLGSIGVQTYLEMQRQYLNTYSTYYDEIISAYESLYDLELLTGGHLEIHTIEEKLQ